MTRNGLIATIVLVGGSGCISAQSLTRGGIAEGEKLNLGSCILLMPIEDGLSRSDGSQQGSGRAVIAGLRDALVARKLSTALVDVSSVDVAIQKAQALRCRYLLKTMITEWEDNATEWSGKPDSLAVSAELLDVGAMRVVSTATHREQSSGVALVPASTDRYVPLVTTRIVETLFNLPRTDHPDVE